MKTAEPESRGVVLLSGGLDSVTVLAVARAQGVRAHALSFDYGQRHAVELGCARRQARRLGAAGHEIVDLSHLGRLVQSATALVAGSELAVPKDTSPKDTSPKDTSPKDTSPKDTSPKDTSPGASIPVTYVPARNTLFLSYALAWAEALEATSIWIGVNALDYSGYPDCRPDFIAAYQRMADLATRVGVEAQPGAGIRIRTPLVDLRKQEIIALGDRHGVDYADTVSCYDPRADDAGPLACGRCESCSLRREGFASAGVPDPTRYT